MGAARIADETEPDRVELVERLDLAVRVPPLGGYPGEFLDLFRVDRGAVQRVGRCGEYSF